MNFGGIKQDEGKEKERLHELLSSLEDEEKTLSCLE